MPPTPITLSVYKKYPINRVKFPAQALAWQSQVSLDPVKHPPLRKVQAQLVFNLKLTSAPTTDVCIVEVPWSIRKDTFDSENFVFVGTG